MTHIYQLVPVLEYADFIHDQDIIYIYIYIYIYINKAIQNLQNSTLSMTIGIPVRLYNPFTKIEIKLKKN